MILRATPGTKVVTSASLAARLAALAVVAVAAHAFSSASFDLVVYSLAVSSAIQVLLDPATANFIVVKWPELDPRARESLWKGGFHLQVVVAAVSVVATTAVVYLARPSHEAVEIATAFGVLAGAEGIARYVRTHWQAEHRFGRYAAVDGVLTVERLLVALVVLIFGSVEALTIAATVLGVAVAAASFAVAYRAKARAMPLVVVARGVWPYGVSTIFSSVYSQSPPVLLGLIGDLRAAAVYSVASRITQPTELLPNAIVAVYLPRLRRAAGSARQALWKEQVRVATTLGVVFTILIMLVSPWILPALGISLAEGEVTLAILALILPIKFLNYQLVALALADGQIKRRLVVSAAVAIVSVVAVCLVSPAGSVAVAVVTFGCELTLAILLALVAVHRGVAREAVMS